MDMSGVPPKLTRTARKIDSLLRGYGFHFQQAEKSRHIYTDKDGAKGQVDYVAGFSSFGMKAETCAFVEVSTDRANAIGQVRPGLLTNTDLRELGTEIDHFMWARRR